MNSIIRPQASQYKQQQNLNKIIKFQIISAPEWSWEVTLTYNLVIISW